MRLECEFDKTFYKKSLCCYVSSLIHCRPICIVYVFVCVYIVCRFLFSISHCRVDDVFSTSTFLVFLYFLSSFYAKFFFPPKSFFLLFYVMYVKCAWKRLYGSSLVISSNKERKKKKNNKIHLFDWLTFTLFFFWSFLFLYYFLWRFKKQQQNSI